MPKKPKKEINLEYHIGNVSDEFIENMNKEYAGTSALEKPMVTMDEEIVDSLLEIRDKLYELLEENGNYIDDSITIEVKLTYKELNK